MNSNRRLRRGTGHRGFSLIELLIVVAIILIVSAIAIPNLVRSRIAANESAAVAASRKIVTAQVVYASTYGGSYSDTLQQLGPPPGGSNLVSEDNAGLLDEVIVSGSKHGYVFTYSPLDSDGDGRNEAFTLTAAPISPGLTGNRYFYTDHSGVIRQSLTGPADVNSTPVG